MFGDFWAYMMVYIAARPKSSASVINRRKPQNSSEVGEESVIVISDSDEEPPVKAKKASLKPASISVSSKMQGGSFKPKSTTHIRRNLAANNSALTQHQESIEFDDSGNEMSVQSISVSRSRKRSQAIRESIPNQLVLNRDYPDVIIIDDSDDEQPPQSASNPQPSCGSQSPIKEAVREQNLKDDSRQVSQHLPAKVWNPTSNIEADPRAVAPKSGPQEVDELHLDRMATSEFLDREHNEQPSNPSQPAGSPKDFSKAPQTASSPFAAPLDTFLSAEDNKEAHSDQVHTCKDSSVSHLAEDLNDALVLHAKDPTTNSPPSAPLNTFLSAGDDSEAHLDQINTRKDSSVSHLAEDIDSALVLHAKDPPENDGIESEQQGAETALTETSLKHGHTLSHQQDADDSVMAPIAWNDSGRHYLDPASQEARTPSTPRAIEHDPKSSEKVSPTIRPPRINPVRIKGPFAYTQGFFKKGFKRTPSQTLLHASENKAASPDLVAGSSSNPAQSHSTNSIPTSPRDEDNTNAESVVPSFPSDFDVIPAVDAPSTLSAEKGINATEAHMLHLQHAEPPAAPTLTPIVTTLDSVSHLELLKDLNAYTSDRQPRFSRILL